MTDFCPDEFRAFDTQSGATTSKAAVVLKAVVADDAVADEVGPYAVAQRDVGEYAGTEGGYGFSGAAVVIDVVILYDTVAQGGILLQIDACAVAGSPSVLDGEAVPGDCRGLCEVGRLVEHPSGVLSVEDGGVGLEVAQGEVVAGRFVACEAAIYIHAGHHIESVVGGGVAVVGALGHPHHGIVRLRQGLRIRDGGGGVLPAVAKLCAGTLLRDIDDVTELGHGAGVVVRLVAAHVHCVVLDADIPGQVGGVEGTHQKGVAPVHAGGSVGQPPVGVARGVGCAHSIGGVYETGTEWAGTGVLRGEGDVALSIISAFHSAVFAVERG